MKKSDRQLIFDKYKGKCAYCGCTLEKGWHVDEVDPVRRNHIWNNQSRRYVIDKDNPMTHPERLHIDNQNPSCPSCNIFKGTDTIEQFREHIKRIIGYLNKHNTSYRFAKKYGLIVEKDFDIVFHFEEKPLTEAQIKLCKAIGIYEEKPVLFDTEATTWKCAKTLGICEE